MTSEKRKQLKMKFYDRYLEYRRRKNLITKPRNNKLNMRRYKPSMREKFQRALFNKIRLYNRYLVAYFMVPKVENIEIKEELKKEFEPNQYRYETNSFTKFITQPRQKFYKWTVIDPEIMIKQCVKDEPEDLAPPSNVIAPVIDRPVKDKSVTQVTELSITETQSPRLSEIQKPEKEPDVVMNKPKEEEENDEPLSIPNTPCAVSTPAVQVVQKCDPRPFDSGLGQSDMDSEISSMFDDPVKQKLFDLSQNNSSYNLRPRKETNYTMELDSV